MTGRRDIAALLLVCWLTGCVAPVDDAEPPSDGALLESISEGANQVSALAHSLRTGLLAQRELLRSRVSAQLGADAGPLLFHAHEGPGAAAQAANELHRMLLEQGSFADAEAAFDQLLSADPTNPSGPISGAGGGCATLVALLLQPDITEADPPLARLVVALDSSSGSTCHVDGNVHYDLRSIPDGTGGGSLRIVMSYPDGLTITPDTGAPFVVDAGGSIFVGLELDASHAPTALEAGADYCVRRGAMGTRTCFEEVELEVTGAVSASVIDGTCATCGTRYGDALADALAGDAVRIVVGSSVALDATGTVRRADDTLTLGGAAPLRIEVGADSSMGVWATLDGEASTTIGGDTAAYLFSERVGAVVPGLGATVPLGSAAVVLDGCAARTAGTETSTVCFSDLEVALAEPSTAGAIRVTAQGALIHTTADSEATYTFTAMSAEALDETITLDGGVTRDTDDASTTAHFVSFSLTYGGPSFTIGGAVELLDGASLLVRAEFCPGSTYQFERSSSTSTLIGCLSLDSPRFGVITLGTETSAMTVSLAPSVVTLDGPLAYVDRGGNEISSLTFEGWSAEDLGSAPETGLHSRLTGRILIDVLGLTGSLESTSGVEAQLSVAGDTSSVALDGDVDASIDTGPRTVTASVTLTGYSATFTDPAIEHQGVIDMDLGVSDTVLPSSSMRVTLGDGVTPFSTTFERVAGTTTTTLQGPMELGIGCATGMCNENVDVVLTGVAFRSSEACGRQHPHVGIAEMSGLRPATSALVPALQVRCECDGRAGRDTLLPTQVTMRFTEATPIERRIQIDAALGVCRLVPGRRCNEPGAAWLLDDTTCGT